jgi:hypothetical protein
MSDRGGDGLSTYKDWSDFQRLLLAGCAEARVFDLIIRYETTGSTPPTSSGIRGYDDWVT